MSRQDTERLPTVFPAMFELGGKEHEGMAVDISPKGLRLRTNSPLATEQTLNLRIITPGSGEVRCTGVVRWVLELSVPFRPTYMFEAGLGLRAPGKEYLDLVERQSARFVDYRDSPRVRHPMRVELSGPGVRETTYALDMGRRGLFVCTEHPMQPGQFVELKMWLPDGASIQLRGKVAHVRSRDEALASGTEPGVGVHITALPQRVLEAYTAYIEALETNAATTGQRKEKT